VRIVDKKDWRVKIDCLEAKWYLLERFGTSALAKRRVSQIELRVVIVKFLLSANHVIRVVEVCSALEVKLLEVVGVFCD